MTRILQSGIEPANSSGRSERSTLDVLKYIKDCLASLIFHTNSSDTERTMIEKALSERIFTPPLTATRGLTIRAPEMSCQLRVGNKTLSMKNDMPYMLPTF